MKLIYRVLLAVLFLIFSSDLRGQVTSIPLSTVYLHTDRSYYLAGESIMFKAYILEDPNNRSNPINDTLHLSFLDQDGLEISSANFPLDNSQIAGNIKLPDILTDGNYILIASTRSTNNLSPEKMFSRVIEIRKSFEYDIITDLSLTDTLYESGSLLTAKIRFSGKGNKPVSASFSYKLNGVSDEILSGKSKANAEGIADLKIQLPAFDNKESLKLIVMPSANGIKNITGVVIPTRFNYTDRKKQNNRNISANEFKHLNVQITTGRLNDDKVQVDITVIDDKGIPVMGSLSVSASNIIPNHLSVENDNIVWYSNLKQTTGNSNMDKRNYFTRILLQTTQSPGIPFVVQEKNNVKKLRRKEESVSQNSQKGYSSDRNIFDILMQIKPYHMENGKITFGISSLNSVNNLDGALIIVDGVKMGTDASILNTIPVPDIARISVSTNLMEIQRYSAMNNVGIIEIFMKKTDEFVKNGEDAASVKNNTLFWGPDIITDNSGKASVSFLNNEKSSEILVSVEGISAGGVAGCNTVQYRVK